MLVIHAEFKRTTEEALKRIESSLKDHSGKVVYTDKCIECKDNRDNQFHALNEKLDILLERRQNPR